MDDRTDDAQDDAYRKAVEHHRRMQQLGVTTLPPVEGLAACPFCHSVPRWKPAQDEAETEEEGEPVYRVSCWWCGAQGPAAGSEKEAATAWNRREPAKR